mgnify:FL=1|tara:strand:+ start:305 stop:523 length:219 start_codon:yes stop_codon:yes gene_type:complete
MTQQQTLKFSIRQDGTVTEEVMGVVGTECENLTKQVEERLGIVERVEHKPEYYEIINVAEEVYEFTHDSEGC